MIPSSIDIGLLRSFALVCRTGNLSLAAGELDRTQSALSMQMQRLEDLAGRRLLRRTGRGVVPTAEGEAFLSYVTRMLAIGDDAMERMRKSASKEAIRIGMPEDAALRLVPTALSRLHRSGESEVELDVIIENTAVLEPLWHQNRLDVMIATPTGVPSGALATWRVDLRWVCSPCFEPRPNEPMPLVVFPEPCNWRRGMFQLLTEVGIDYRIAFASPGIAAVQAALESGLGVGLMMPEGIRQNAVRLAPPTFGLPEPVTVHYGLYARPNRSAAVQALVNAIVNESPTLDTRLRANER